MTATKNGSDGNFAQLVAEIEVAELERGAAIAPLFLWLWEHRVQISGLLTAGTSWTAIAGALGRIGLTGARGEPPSVEHCRAAWGRVVAFEPLVAGHSLAQAVAGAAEASINPASVRPAPLPVVQHAAEPAASGEPVKRGGDGIAESSLGTILAQRRRSALADPPPLDLAFRDRRQQRQSPGEEQ